jgi:lipid-A-disaccharide synthase
VSTAILQRVITAARTRLLVSAGETSGDLYAAELVRHLRPRLEGPLDVFGLGGDRLLEQDVRLVAHVRDLAVVGLVEVVRHLRRLRGIFRSVLAAVDAERPRLAVLVDYPDFHLRLARELKRRGVPVVYYVSPQVWAWRRGRLRTIRDNVAHMIVIFPFEEALYREAGIEVTFVGHPLVEFVSPAPDPAAFLRGHGLDPSRPVLAALPGSRRQEVAHNLPALGGALRLVAERRPDVQLALAVAPGLDGGAFPGLDGLALTRIAGQTHALMGAATAGIVASGTATVEAALLGLPMVVVYRLSRLTYALGRPFVRVPHFAMANLIAGRSVVKELIQSDFRPEATAAEALRLIEAGTYREEVTAGLAEVRQRLGGPGASARAAAVVQRLLRDDPATT